MFAQLTFTFKPSWTNLSLIPRFAGKNMSNTLHNGCAGSFSGTTVGKEGTGVELPCGFSQWWLNHKNRETEGCPPQGLSDCAAFSGRTAALGKWWCRFRSEDIHTLEGRQRRVAHSESVGKGWGAGVEVGARGSVDEVRTQDTGQIRGNSSD